MISRKTLDILNSTGFGADIDKFELFMVRVKESIEDGQPIISSKDAEDLFKVLREIKPESDVFSSSVAEDKEESISNETKIYNTMYNKFKPKNRYKAFEVSEKGLEAIYRVTSMKSGVDIIAKLMPVGIRFRAVYVDSVLCAVYILSNNQSDKDITEVAKMHLPNDAESLTGKYVTEVRGFITESKSSGKYQSTAEIYDYVTSGTYNKKSEIKFIAESVYSDGINDSFQAIDNLDNDEFETVYNIMIADINNEVSSKSIVTAANRAISYFESLVEDGLVTYDCSGVVLELNDINMLESTVDSNGIIEASVEIRSGKFWDSNVYESVVESIAYKQELDYMSATASIKPVVIGGIVVSDIKVGSLEVVKTRMITTGSIIKFNYNKKNGASIV